MARPAPPTDVIRVAMSGTIFNHVWNNIFWVRVTTDGTRTVNDLAALLDAMITSYTTNFLNHMSSSVNGLTAEGVWTTSPTTALSTVRTATHTGPAGATVADAGASVVVSWKIGARYRGGKPRSYIPGPLASDVSNGSDVSSSLRTALAAGAVAFQAAVNAFTGTHITSAELGTVSFFTAGGSETTPPTYRTPPVFEPYIGSGIRARLGSQRRRIRS
jgi:hypothetical protein